MVNRITSNRSAHSVVAAYSRVELLVIGAMLLVLVFVAAALHNGSRSARVAKCASNLKDLGSAMAFYEEDNNGRLPYAFVVFSGGKYETWDGLILPSSSPKSLGRSVLRCPSDTIPARWTNWSRRTYSMPTHSMSGDPWCWPLGPDNATGVGLWFQSGGWSMSALKSTGTGKTGTSPPLPAIRLDMIRQPASTLLLTENVRTDNLAFHYYGATIDGPSQHLERGAIKRRKYHSGRFEYLMVDGHAELLWPLESVGRVELLRDNSDKRYPNIWTMRPED